MKFLKFISLFLTGLAVTIGFLQLTHQQNHQGVPQQNIDINLTQPGPPPPPQFQYLQVGPGSPLYHVLPQGWPLEYYNCPQFYFYHEPNDKFFRHGESVFLGGGWWYTHGCGLINIGFFNPNHPFSSCPVHPQNKIVQTTVNISNTHTTIDLERSNRVMPPPHQEVRPEVRPVRPETPRPEVHPPVAPHPEVRPEPHNPSPAPPHNPTPAPPHNPSPHR